MVPLPQQEALSGGKYREMGYDVVCTHGNPYGDPAVISANAAKFRGCRAVVLHCMGYNRDHKRLVEEASGCLVLEANAVMAHLGRELLS